MIVLALVNSQVSSGLDSNAVWLRMPLVDSYMKYILLFKTNYRQYFSKLHVDINYWAYPHKLVHVAISTVYYLYLNTKAHKYVHCLIEYSLFILTKHYIIESYENSMFMSLFSPYLYSYTQMCTPPLISQDVHRFCLVYTTTCTLVLIT